MNQIINDKLLIYFKAITINNEIEYCNNEYEYWIVERIFDSRIKFYSSTSDIIDSIFDIHIDGDQFNVFEHHDKNIYIINLYLLLRIFIIYGRIEKQKTNK